MRHLVGFFMIAGVLGGCSMSTVGSMDPEEGGKCDTPMETKRGADGCSECTCDGSTWSCEDDACAAVCTDGATKAADDGCNTCTCAMGSWDCTTNEECGGMECQPGETKLGDGGCYRCDCDSTGRWICPDIQCTQCTPGEMTGTECVSCECNEQGTWSCSGPADGVCGEPMCTPGTMMPAGDGCNTCTCTEDGTRVCTTKACGEPLVCDPGRVSCDGDERNGCEVDINTSPDNCGACGFVCLSVTGTMGVCTVGVCSSPEDDTCLYQGVDYQVGASFPSRDGCNVCECVDTGMGASANCTDLGCACDPADEASYRDYVVDAAGVVDPAGCMELDEAMCPEHTSWFSNACGCGCEQSVECPPTYQCPPDGTMSETCAELEVRCPYTELSSAP